MMIITYGLTLIIFPNMTTPLVMAIELMFGLSALASSAALLFFLANIRPTRKTILDRQFEINICIKIVMTLRCLAVLLLGSLSGSGMDIDILDWPWPLFNLLAGRTVGLVQANSYFHLSLSKLLLLLKPATFQSLSLRSTTIYTVLSIVGVSVTDYILRYRGKFEVKS